MLRKLLVTGIAFVAGYAVGARYGFKAAVIDYVENNGKMLDEHADLMYESESVQPPTEEELAEAYKDLSERYENGDDENNGIGFQ